MPFSVRLHGTINKYSCLKKWTQKTREFLLTHATAYKIALLVNHIFRAVASAAFMAALPFSFPVNLALCFGGSLFYRVTVENNCAYKFALPAFAGGVSFPLAKTALLHFVNGVAFKTLANFASSCVSLIPITAYIAYVIGTVDYDVDMQCKNASN